MTSREEILRSLNKPRDVREPHPDNLSFVNQSASDELVAKFSETLRSIGGAVLTFDRLDETVKYIDSQYANAVVVSAISGLGNYNEGNGPAKSYSNTRLAVIRGNFGVAENGAVWVTDNEIPERVLPFICEDLIVMLQLQDIVATLHEAYDRIGNGAYSFATFIAGPSKTADIEQSLVLGAHGPKAATVILVRERF